MLTIHAVRTGDQVLLSQDEFTLLIQKVLEIQPVLFFLGIGCRRKIHDSSFALLSQFDNQLQLPPELALPLGLACPTDSDQHPVAIAILIAFALNGEPADACVRSSTVDFGQALEQREILL